MTSHESPAYVSQKCFRSLWQEYRVFSDRIELDTLFNTIVIKKDQILSIQVCPAFRNSIIALKLDMADLFIHISITRKNGIFKNLSFTPNDPNAFLEAVRSVMNL
ncbi:MAG: hypothetical protein PHV05_05030 [Candidatus Riflebacteria bacterium]|nr:hypothetical protein [Candidatus Riflebacteria bacterium]